MKLALIALGLLAPAALACATSQFDSYMESGQYEAAVSEFARDSSLHADPEAALEVAELFASPDSRLYDRDRAVRMLQGWLERYPSDPNRFRADLALSLLEETERLESRVARQDSIAARLSENLALGVTTRDTLEGRVVFLLEDRQVLVDSVAALQARIDVLTDELRRVRHELEQLKEIDVSGP